MSKFIDIQKDLKVLKNQFNKFGNYSFRSSEDILLALKPLLVKYDCELTLSDKIHTMNEHVYIEAIATLKSDNKEYIASSFARDAIVQKGMSASQCTNSASSFARKQCLSGLFLLDDTATPIASKEEQEVQEEKQAEVEADKEKVVRDRENACVNAAREAIEKTLSVEELTAVYKTLYRDARKLGQQVADQVETAYRNKKSILLSESKS